MEPPTPPSTSKPFTHLTDESAFTLRHHRLHYTQVHVVHPPQSLSSDHLPWITARETTANNTVIFRHPLTSKPHSFSFPKNLHLSELRPSTISLSYHLGESYPVDKLLVFPAESNFVNHYDSNYCALLALYGGGQIRGSPRYGPKERASGSDHSPWVKFSSRHNFDDLTVFRDMIFSVTDLGCVTLIHTYKTTTRLKMGAVRKSWRRTLDKSHFGWRKRFVIHGGKLYLVVRIEEKWFRVYNLSSWGTNTSKGFEWCEARGFDGKVLFMARDYYFFREASGKFPGREYKNCIVFSEAAFPQYGKDGWEFTQSGDRQFSEDDIAVFCLDNKRFAREEEGENSGFPKIDWSPPDWILNFSSFSADAFKKHSESESSSSQSEREPHEDEGLDSDSGEKNDEEVQSGLKNPKIKDKEEQEEMESDFGCLDQDQEGVVSDSDNQGKADGNMQCDLTSQEKEDDRMHANASAEVGASLQEDVCHGSPSLFRPEYATTVTQTPSLSATEKEITRTLLSLNGGNNATEEETLRKNNTELVHRACTSSTTACHKSDSATAKFEGFDIRLDSVSTLEKIWQKHGNIVENSAVRNGEIIARALDSLATIVRILDDNSPLSLSDSQADYLVSTLSDLRYIHFKVDWLIPFVEKAKKIHQSKSSLESLNTLSQFSSQAQERRAILLDELTKLDVEEKNRKEEMAKISKTIPFWGQVKFDEPLGSGLT